MVKINDECEKDRDTCDCRHTRNLQLTSISLVDGDIF